MEEAALGNSAASAAATTAVNSDILDMQGFEGVAFFGSIATKNAGNYAKVQQGANASLTDAADLEGTKLVTAADAGSFLIDVYKPQERYVRCVVTRTASTALGEIYAIQYNAHKAPVSQGSSIDAETHISPDEGTA